MRKETKNMIEGFMASQISNSWLDIPTGLSVYMRKDQHLHPTTAELTKTLTIASVNIHDESLRGQGIFTQFLDVMEPIAASNNRPAYIESILNDRLPPFLARRGYMIIAAGYGVHNAILFSPDSSGLFQSR